MTIQAMVVSDRLNKELKDRRSAAWNLFKASRILKALIIFSQLALAYLISFYGGPSGPLLAVVSFVPFVLGMTQRMFASEEASGWHETKRIAIEKLILNFDNGQDPAEVWRDFLALEEDMAAKFPHGSWV